MATEFSNDQYSLAYPDGIEYHWWNRARSWVILRLLRRYCGTQGLVVEVGCGRGVEVQALRRAGVSAQGVELAAVPPLPSVAEWVATGTDAGDLPAAVRESARVLMLLDVLEHLPQPARFLQQLLADYPNVTAVVVTVPARQELWSNYDEFYGHQCRYSLAQLQALGEEAGCETLTAGYFFHLLYLPARLFSLLGRERATRIVPPSRGTRWLHGLVAKVCQCEHVLLPKKTPGSSAYAVFGVQRDAT